MRCQIDNFCMFTQHVRITNKDNNDMYSICYVLVV